MRLSPHSLSAEGPLAARTFSCPSLGPAGVDLGGFSSTAPAAAAATEYDEHFFFVQLVKDILTAPSLDLVDFRGSQ